MDCPSGKVVHTLQTAKAASKRARRTYESPMQAYRCSVCGAWHVGSKTHMPKPMRVIHNNHELRMT